MKNYGEKITKSIKCNDKITQELISNVYIDEAGWHRESLRMFATTRKSEQVFENAATQLAKERSPTTLTLAPSSPHLVVPLVDYILQQAALLHY